ncbi:MAG: hypothetical protein U0931_20600 [Vulcanimicrobiota bacterium]
MLEQLLEALRPQPRTLAELRQMLAVSQGQVESALLQLRRGGYVDRAVPNQGACHTGCGMCSHKSFCPSQVDQLATTAQETWRLTDKALSRVAPPA